MNALLAAYKRDFPQDTRSDDVVLLDLARQRPDLIESFPDAAEDLKRIHAEIAASNRPGAVDYLKQATGSAIRGAADVAAGLPEAIGIASAGLNRKLKEATGLSLGDESDPTQQVTYQLGQKIREIGESISPDEDPRLAKSFLATTVPQGIGSAAGFMVGGGVGKAAVQGGLEAAAKTGLEALAARAAGAVPIAGLGAATAGAGAWKEAKAAGASDDDALKVFLLNAGVGTSEIIPLSDMLHRLDKVSGGTFSRTLINAGKETFEEALQESVQQVAGNAIAREYFDKDRSLWQGLAESAGAGGA
ncbi:MAG TPA: hypothetical protein VNT26_14210, partial [Candidatus Sulfotelmatobacter sp.]|nr:hypothetical protein [Candidatus Sulfotelmatobacter sp.]